MKGNNKCCSRILPHAGKWKPYLCYRFSQGAYSLRLPCELMGVWLHGRTLAQHTHGSILITTKIEKGTHNSMAPSISRVTLFSTAMTFTTVTNLKIIRRWEEAIEHVGPSPGRGPWCPWCPLMAMPKHKQAQTTNSEFTVWYTGGSKCKVVTRASFLTHRGLWEEQI